MIAVSRGLVGYVGLMFVVFFAGCLDCVWGVGLW